MAMTVSSLGSQADNQDSGTRRACRLAVQFDVGELGFDGKAFVTEKPSPVLGAFGNTDAMVGVWSSLQHGSACVLVDLLHPPSQEIVGKEGLAARIIHFGQPQQGVINIGIAHVGWPMRHPRFKSSRASYSEFRPYR